jgi:hypothetical protein
MKAKNKAVFVYLGEDQRKWLDKLAETRRTSVSGVVRQIIDDYFNSLKKGV